MSDFLINKSDFEYFNWLKFFFFFFTQMENLRCVVTMATVVMFLSELFYFYHQ